MVDNLALLMAHVAMIFVLWRCFVLPDADDADAGQTDASNQAKDVKTEADKVRARRGKVKFRA